MFSNCLDLEKWPDGSPKLLYPNCFLTYRWFSQIRGQNLSLLRHCLALIFSAPWIMNTNGSWPFGLYEQYTFSFTASPAPFVGLRLRSHESFPMQPEPGLMLTGVLRVGWEVSGSCHPAKWYLKFSSTKYPNKIRILCRTHLWKS